MTDIRQCWAFHRDGARCQHPAGHPGDHAIEQTWSDAECATPGEFAPVPYIPTERVVEQAVLEPCVACTHMHVAGPCKCGCYEHI